MLFTRSSFGALALALALVSPASAQDRAVALFARSGGYNALTNLDDAGSADFKKVGYTVGGGVGVQVHRYVTLRGDFNYARNPFRQNQVETGQDVNRFFYDAAVQLHYPTDIGLEPYIFAGGGAVTIHQVGTSGQDKTRATGTAGLGLNYTVPASNLGFFIEGKSWLYSPKDLTGVLAGIDKLQYEVAWAGGISYRFPF
ncbi:MAG: outer membrane beta-barrel protein [Gemmatimonadetes bacterium]|nr:outer membrane beta-barrel protein [Gemmatimonadota bacterium]